MYVQLNEMAYRNLLNSVYVKLKMKQLIIKSTTRQ